MIRFLVSTLTCVTLAGCTGSSESEAVAETESSAEPQTTLVTAMEVDLLAGGIDDWSFPEEISGNAGAGMTSEGTLLLKAGSPNSPISGARYTGPWTLPENNYEIVFEARRVDGVDFFAALTFPVRSNDTCATFIAGGWGGAVTGLSCIDDMDASSNETTHTFHFPDGEWFTFRIEVLPETLKIWNGSAIIANVPLQGRRIGMRRGDIEYCAPFGLASYMTEGEVRKLKIRKLSGAPIRGRRAQN